jgi:predicted Zn finger-like uncharacterized protein
MLFTRCPDCDTTFRVTDEALKKANGQVRCGRCAGVFNAYAERQGPRPPAEDAAPAPPPSAQPEAAQTSPPEPPLAAAAPPPEPTPPPALTPLVPLEARATPAEPRTPPTDSVAASIGAASIAAVVAEVDLGAADANAITGELAAPAPLPEQPISAAAVDEVLTSEPVAAQPVATAPMPMPQLGPAPAARGSRWWSLAAVLALLALGVQTLNHYRADLAGDARFGPWVQSAYAAVGVMVTPSWDVHQYEILDWVASAEPNTRGLGSLKITARIQNRGPSRQPFPSVQLQLKDRWEDAVGRRMFTPAEYLPRNAALGRLMAPGETARAELEVVDPGPDAYGFELDVCIEVQPNELSCGNDKVFL